MNIQELYDNILSRKKGGEKVSFAWLVKQTAIDMLVTMMAYDGLPDSIPEEFI